MKIKADYHFHPNLPKSKNRALKKSKQWWQVIQNAGLNCMIVTEHVYKEPERTYRFMSQTCPKELYCFPGVEYITEEGIDIVIFSKTEKLYDHHELMTPFALSYRQTVDFVNSNDHLNAFVTHPFTLGATSIVNILGLDHYHCYANELNAVEVSNGSFDDLIKVIEISPFCFLMPHKLEWAKNTQELPVDYYPEQTNLLAVGSDAHIFEDIGNHVELNVKKSDYDSVFYALTNNSDGKVLRSEKKFNLLALFKNLPIVVKEALIKKKIRLCSKLFSSQFG